MTVFSQKILNSLLGGEVVVNAKNDIDCYTARTFTDTVQQSHITPQIRFTNARAWVDRAYRDGYEAGKANERGEWERKIRAVFGIGCGK